MVGRLFGIAVGSTTNIQVLGQRIDAKFAAAAMHLFPFPPTPPIHHRPPCLHDFVYEHSDSPFDKKPTRCPEICSGRACMFFFLIASSHSRPYVQSLSLIFGRVVHFFCEAFFTSFAELLIRSLLSSSYFLRLSREVSRFSGRVLDGVLLQSCSANADKSTIPFFQHRLPSFAGTIPTGNMALDPHAVHDPGGSTTLEGSTGRA